MKPILVIGASGQIGRALMAKLGNKAIGLTRAQIDLSRPETLPLLLSPYDPSAIINAAAYTAVDKAEQEEDIANAINGEAPGVLAELCRSLDIPFIHYSTDYVFDGKGDRPWTEIDPVAPINAYGRSKLLGERRIEEAGGHYWIFRTSWVYDAFGKNFFNTMLRLGAEREELAVVNDQYGAPSYAPHLADATIKALTNPGAAPGIYHMCNAGMTTWHGFAQAIFTKSEKAGFHQVIKNLRPIASEEYPTPAARPMNSRLDCTKLREVFGILMPDWWDGLNACMEVKHENARLPA